MKKPLTLCMVCEGDKVLLGMKKRGFGVGLWNGFGGKVEDGETIEDAAIRETQEEIGITPQVFTKVGVITFAFESDPNIQEVHIFKVMEFNGVPKESEEMKPEWFDIKDVPFDQMWPDDKYWFPYLIENKLFKGSFVFDAPSNGETMSTILTQELVEVESI